jgi:hypothetical protein
VGSFVICTLAPNNIRQIKIKENEVGGACGTRGRGEEMCKLLVGKLEGKRPLGGPRRRWEIGIKIDFR